MAGWNADMQLACAPALHHTAPRALAKAVSWGKVIPVSCPRTSQLHSLLCPQSMECLLQLSDHRSFLTAEGTVLFLGCFPAACCCLQPQCSTTAPKALDTQTVPVTHQIPNKTATLPPHKAFLFSFFFFLRQSITPNYNVLFLALVQICVSPIMSPSGIDKSFTSPSGLLCQMRNCYIFTRKQLLMFNFLHKMLWKWRCNTPSSC